MSSGDQRAAARRRLFQARDLALGGLFGALGVVLPIAFHAVQLGKAFLPMHLPILALGMLAGWEVALIVGFITPLLSAALTGMPPMAPPVAPLMAPELAVLGASASLLRARGVPVWLVAPLAILAARALDAAAIVTIAPLMGFHQSVYAFVIVGLATSVPGVILQLTLVPGAVYAIERTSLLVRNRPPQPTDEQR
jgi:hypothetical protein